MIGWENDSLLATIFTEFTAAGEINPFGQKVIYYKE